MALPRGPVNASDRRTDHPHPIPHLLVTAALLQACSGGAPGSTTAETTAETTTEATTGSVTGSTADGSATQDPTEASSGTSGGGTSGTSGTSSTSGTSDATTGGDTTGTTTGAPACDPGATPTPLDPCGPASCWSTLTFSGICGPTDVDEDFSSGNYNVHRFELSTRAGVPVTLTLARTGGDFDPALIVHDELGATVYDGQLGVCEAGLTVEALSSGQDSDTASVRLVPASDMRLTLFLTGWHVVDGGFAPAMPLDATYTFRVDNDCQSETGAFDPPNFDEGDVVDGYHLLPDSDPPGLYEHKDDDCSRGTRRLVQVLATVAARWHALRPEFTPIAFRDLNEAWCSSVDHSTHDDGTHADLVVDCATDNGCSNWIPAFDLARLFIDTGEVCGILFLDTKVQSVVNPYFDAHHAYEPWKQLFMRTVDGHDQHFHIRVKKPDGTCN